MAVGETIGKSLLEYMLENGGGGGDCGGLSGQYISGHSNPISLLPLVLFL